MVAMTTVRSLHKTVPDTYQMSVRTVSLVILHIGIFSTPVLKQLVVELASYIMLCNLNLRQRNIWFRSGT